MIQTAAHQASATLAATTQGSTSVLVPPPDYVVTSIVGGIIIVAAVVIAAVFAARVKRAAALQSRELLAGSAFLAEQLDKLHAALSVADERVAALAARLDEQSRAAQGGSSTSYNVAIRMARSGATRQELVTTCGVTQQEADLVLRLHASDPTVRSAA